MPDVSSLLARLRDLPMTVGTPSYVRVDDPLCRTSIFEDIPRAEKDAFVAGAVAEPPCDRAVGCLVGMAVGDAVGGPLEFMAARDDAAAGAPGALTRSPCGRRSAPGVLASGQGERIGAVEQPREDDRVGRRTEVSRRRRISEACRGG